MNNKELELEAEKYTTSKEWSNSKPETWVQNIFIAGATSNAAKEYWYKQFEKQKLEFAIEQLNKLDSTLQSKVETLKEMASFILKDDVNDFENYNLFHRKIEGVRLTKEEIRRDIKELEQQLNNL